VCLYIETDEIFSDYEKESQRNQRKSIIIKIKKGCLPEEKLLNDCTPFLSSIEIQVTGNSTKLPAASTQKKSSNRTIKLNGQPLLNTEGEPKRKYS